MTNRRWRALKTGLLISVVAVVVVGLTSSPLSSLPSSVSPSSPVTPADASGSTKVLASNSEQTNLAGDSTGHLGMAPTVAVIGSGLAGLSAAYELSNAFKNELPQAKVVIFEKNSILGGNSAKASSGINAVNAAAGDSTAAYAADTNKSGGGFSTQELVDTLAVSAVAALQAYFRLLRGGGVSVGTTAERYSHRMHWVEPDCNVQSGLCNVLLHDAGLRASVCDAQALWVCCISQCTCFKP